MIHRTIETPVTKIVLGNTRTRILATPTEPGLGRFDIFENGRRRFFGATIALIGRDDDGQVDSVNGWPIGRFLATGQVDPDNQFALGIIKHEAFGDVFSAVNAAADRAALGHREEGDAVVAAELNVIFASGIAGVLSEVGIFNIGQDSVAIWSVDVHLAQFVLVLIGMKRNARLGQRDYDGTVANGHLAVLVGEDLCAHVGPVNGHVSVAGRGQAHCSQKSKNELHVD